MSISDKHTDININTTTNTTAVERADFNVMVAYDQVKAAIEIKEITTGNLMAITVTAIPIIQRMITEPSRGQYKKNVLIAVIKKLVEEFVASASDRAMINLVVDTTVSSAIDMLIDVARGAVDIGKGKKGNCCLIV